MATVSTTNGTTFDGWELEIHWLRVGDGAFAVRGRKPTWIGLTFLGGFVGIANAILMHLPHVSVYVIVLVHTVCMWSAALISRAFRHASRHRRARIASVIVNVVALGVSKLANDVAPDHFDGYAMWTAPIVTLATAVLVTLVREALCRRTRRLNSDCREAGEDGPCDAQPLPAT